MAASKAEAAPEEAEESLPDLVRMAASDVLSHPCFAIDVLQRRGKVPRDESRKSLGFSI